MLRVTGKPVVRETDSPAVMKPFANAVDGPVPGQFTDFDTEKKIPICLPIVDSRSTVTAACDGPAVPTVVIASARTESRAFRMSFLPVER